MAGDWEPHRDERDRDRDRDRDRRRNRNRDGYRDRRRDRKYDRDRDYRDRRRSRSRSRDHYDRDRERDRERRYRERDRRYERDDDDGGYRDGGRGSSRYAQDGYAHTRDRNDYASRSPLSPEADYGEYDDYRGNKGPEGDGGGDYYEDTGGPGQDRDMEAAEEEKESEEMIEARKEEEQWAERFGANSLVELRKVLSRNILSEGLLGKESYEKYVSFMGWKIQPNLMTMCQSNFAHFPQFAKSANEEVEAESKVPDDITRKCIQLLTE